MLLRPPSNRALPDPPSRIARPGPLALLCGLLLVSAPACHSIERLRPPPISALAEAEFRAARELLREGGAASRTLAREAAERAEIAAPDWVAPKRMLDDFRRQDLLGIEALAARRRDFHENPRDAGFAYLVGRLEGESGIDRFRSAVRLDPRLAWGHHGLAWGAAFRGDLKLALQHEARALDRARNAWERTYFTAAIARYAMLADRPQTALAAIEERLEDPELDALDRTELEVQAAQVELSLSLGRDGRRGYERALGLLRTHDLTGGEVEGIVERMRQFAPFHDPDALELQLALAASPDPVRDRLRAELMLERRPTPLALGLLRRALDAEGLDPPAGPLMRSARFAGGLFRQAVEQWLRGMPRRVLDEEGFPRDSNLRRVVETARALETGSSPDALVDLGDALVRAGWFVEARSVAASLAARDLERALALEDRAVAGQQLLQGIARLVESLDFGPGGLETLQVRGAAPTSSGANGKGGHRKLKNVEGLLRVIEPLVERAWPFVGDGELDSGSLVASPVIDYGFVGALVHPGPRFSAEDEDNGLGESGEPVPGLASLMQRLGRFGLFGVHAGASGPDGTILARVYIEERSGEHLGEDWSGTIAWCEGADLESRFARRGAEISGAAVHEGYWVDLDIVRRQAEAWHAFERRWSGEQNAERIAAALASRGLELETPERARDLRRRERRRVEPLLGEADRLRLAVLRDRLTVSFDELLDITAIHEEGHLCDRSRFLPIKEHLGSIFGLLARADFSFGGVSERLEYRAQLVALCEAEDPRLPLIDVLLAAEGVAGAVTPHASAYHELLSDLLMILERDLHYRPEEWSELDLDFMLVHQLHWIAPEKLRELVLRLARSEGL